MHINLPVPWKPYLIKMNSWKIVSTTSGYIIFRYVTGLFQLRRTSRKCQECADGRSWPVSMLLLGISSRQWELRANLCSFVSCHNDERKSLPWTDKSWKLVVGFLVLHFKDTALFLTYYRINRRLHPPNWGPSRWRGTPALASDKILSHTTSVTCLVRIESCSGHRRRRIVYDRQSEPEDRGNIFPRNCGSQEDTTWCGNHRHTRPALLPRRRRMFLHKQWHCLTAHTKWTKLHPLLEVWYSRGGRHRWSFVVAPSDTASYFVTLSNRFLLLIISCLFLRCW